MPAIFSIVTFLVLLGQNPVSGAQENASATLANAPTVVVDYDALADAAGHIHAKHMDAVQAMVQQAAILEKLYEDAVRGNARAARIFYELETQHFPAIGWAVADQVHGLPCAAPVYRELSGNCAVNWGFLEFLSRDRPGGIRLRKALVDAFEHRARELGIENNIILSMVNAVMAGVLMKGAITAEVRSAAPAVTAAPATPIRWPPAPPARPKPGLDEANAAQWRYERYLHDQHRAGKQAHEVLDFEKWKSSYFDVVRQGGRPGRSGGPEQVTARKKLAEEGYINTERMKLGNRYVDLYRQRPQGGTEYVEVDEMLRNGLPAARVRVKLKEEIPHLGKDDTLVFVDKADPMRRILYRPGDVPGVVEVRAYQPAPPILDAPTKNGPRP